MKKIREIMRQDVVFVERQTSVRQAAGRMIVERLSVLPVCEGGRILGFVTDHEVTKSVAQGLDADRTEVHEIMDGNVPLCSTDDPLAEVVRAMEAKGQHRVFVVDREGRLAGLVSLGSLARENRTAAGGAVRKIARRRS